MCDWTNLEEIMQDLTVAQQFEVPAPLETFDAVRPPAYKVEEEECAEQSYYAPLDGGGGDCSAPELGGIQEMLNMVKEKIDQEPKGPAESSDLGPRKPNILPKRMQKKIKKNVALASILTAKEAEASARHSILTAVTPSMFKKKSLNRSPHRNKEETSKNASPPQTSSTQQCKQYTPSTHASEYYTKYLQKTELKEQLEEDIWDRAERQMKELELKKKRRAEVVCPVESGNESPSAVACAFVDVALSEHRHLMPGDCIVCIVAAKHGYNI